MSAQTRVLVTGAAGRIASRVIPLLGKPFDLRLTDSQPVTAPPFPFERADLLESEQVARVTRGVDAIVHLAIASRSNFKFGRAALTDKEEREEHSFHLESIDVNVKGTCNLFRAATLAGVGQIVYVSSLTVVLGNPPPDWLTEGMPVRPLGVYGCTKLFGEQLGEFYARERGLRVVCLRLGQPYPFGIPHEKERKFTPSGRGTLLGFEDIAQAIECALCATHIQFGVYHIVSESPWRKVDIAAAARDLGYVPRQFCDENGNMVPNPGRAPA